MAPLDRITIEARLADLTDCLAELDTLAEQPREAFIADRHQVALASFYLQRALESVLSIGTHVLARLRQPVTLDEYRQVIPELARVGVLPTDFAERNAALGSYRNRLVHHYMDITDEEIHDIITEHRADLRQFGQLITEVLDHSDRFGLTVE